MQAAARQQQYEGTVTQRLHTEVVLTERQEQEPKVLCQGKALKNCYRFKYLGSIFTADGRRSRGRPAKTNRDGDIEMWAITIHPSTKAHPYEYKTKNIQMCSGLPFYIWERDLDVA